MSKLTTLLFLAAWLVCLGSWFYALAEAIGIWRFWAWAYRKGFRLFEEVVPFPMQRPASPVMNLREVKAKMISPDEILFRAPAPMFGFGIKTPFPIKATLRWSASKAVIVGRLPIGTAIFLGAWLLGWSIGGLFPSKGDVDRLSFVLTGWLVAGVIIAISLPLERRRIRKAKEALIAYLRAGQ